MADTGVDDDGDAWLELSTGHTFFGLPSEMGHERQHKLLRGLLTEVLSPETFLTALDVTHRFSADKLVRPQDLPSRPDGTIVEVGAFLGHKAIRMLDLASPQVSILESKWTPSIIDH